jgi:hypothetical protein
MTATILAICLAIMPAAAVTLALDGQPDATIIVPAEATPTVQLAAAELARYIELISGATLPVVTEGETATGTAIAVGPTELAEAEGIAIHVGDDGVLIQGGSDQATVFAVYRFLEELGCRWMAQDQEFVPTMTTIDVPAMDLNTAPVFNMRVFNARRENLRVWGMKMGMNGFYTAEDVDMHGAGYYLPAAAPSCHAYYKIIPAEMYFEDHPEWFPLIGGQRKPGALHGSQLCVTADGLADEFARRVIEIFDEDPNLSVMSISPNDGHSWCQCEECLALDERLCGSRTTKQGLGSEKPFMGDRVFWFANEVAERVAKVHPDKLLLVLSYVNYAEPPDTIVPADNVVPWLCHYAPADYSRPISDATSEPNAEFNDLLTRWAKQAPHLLFYAYVSKSMWWRLPRPVTHTFAADVKYLHSLGIRRYYCQSTLSDWPEAGPLYYVIAKLLWDPSLNPDEIAADWTTHMFGPAADEMTAYYAAVEDSIKDSGQSFSDNPPKHVPGLYSHEDLARAREHIDAALVAAAGDEVALARVQKVEAMFRYGEHMIAALEAAHEFKLDPTTDLHAQVSEQFDLSQEIYPYKYSKRYFNGIKMQAQFGVVSSGFGDVEEKGGRECWNSDETGLGDDRAGWATFYLNVEDTEHPIRLEMDVWGTSNLGQIVINTGGEQKGYDAGGVWIPVEPEEPLSGEEQWDTLVFNIPVELLAPEKTTQTIGFGGADSQVWVAGIRQQQQ